MSLCSSRPISRLKRWSVPPDLDVGLQRHRVVTLHQRVQKLVEADRLPLLIPLLKVVALSMRATVYFAASSMSEAASIFSIHR